MTVLFITLAVVSTVATAVTVGLAVATCRTRRRFNAHVTDALDLANTPAVGGEVTWIKR